MLRKLADQYRHEDNDLASYAIHNLQSRGRRFPEKPHPLRTNFQRDRDRILHSRAFRRLEYKTQVFLNGTGDHLRTRLTHTIEVAAISRTIARALYLNEDLAESISLAHDLGHTPFGHAGEREINKLMAGHGGFDHNAQALRVVDLLEIKYPGYNGLNLSWEVRSGLVKHRNGECPKLDNIELPPQPSLESQVADLADDLTYYGHDVDDGLDSGLINESMIAELDIWKLASERAKVLPLHDDPERFSAFTVRCLIDAMVEDAVTNSHENLEKFNIHTPEEAQNYSERIVCFSPGFQRMTRQLREFLTENMYFHKEVSNVNDDAVIKMRQMFENFVEKPWLMGSRAQARIKVEGIYRVVSDYIAGMTDRYAFEECKRLFG